MAGLLVTLGIMGIMMSMALPVWSQAAKREREAELIFRGEQYARAVELYQRRFVGAYPADFETLVDQRFLRRLYEDPMTADGEFHVVYAGQMSALQGEPETAARPGEVTSGDADAQIDPIQFDRGAQEGGVVGVVSQSDDESLRIYNGRKKYSEWAFVYVTTDAGGSVSDGDSGTPPTRRGPGGGAGGENGGRFNLDRAGTGAGRRGPGRDAPGSAGIDRNPGLPQPVR